MFLEVFKGRIATLVYKKVLDAKGIRKKIWKYTRIILIRILHDPACSLPIHGRLLKLPLSHPLPRHLYKYEHYDRLPCRISKYFHEKHDNVRCIDVGANVGDSVAAFYKSDENVFLAIEPSPIFHKYLIINWNWNNNVKVRNIICSSESAAETFTIKENHGTASIFRAKEGTTMTSQPLDTIVNDFPEFKNANILKIDTDGHDFEVIAGAKKLISNNQPTVLFECDAFENQNYVEDCLKTMAFFKGTGYNFFLLYDNFGNLMGKYPLADLSAFRNLLFFQLTSPFYYFDILLMKDADISRFFKTEVDYFVERMPQKSLCWAAKVVAEL